MEPNVTNGNVKEAPKTLAAKVPEWINSELFESLLHKNVNGVKKITDFKAFPAMAPGENYATLMLTVQIEAEVEDSKSKSVSYMMKIPLDNELFNQMMLVNNVFEIEKIMYLDVVPEMEQMYKDAGVDVKFGAHCYQFERSVESDYILLEDLRPRGFKNTNRLEGQDLDHIECVLKKMAQWHAATATRIAVKGRYPNNVMNGFYVEKNKPILVEMFAGFTKSLLEGMSTYKGNEAYSEAVEKIQAQIADLFLNLNTPDLNEFNVLNHGDCWSNNIMFQYDEFGKIKETYFVDYQLPKFGTPAQDLFYYLISSSKLELKVTQFDYFIRIYHENLVKNLKLLKYPKKIPTLKELHALLYKYGLWGYTTATGVMTVVLADPSENSNMDNFIGQNEAGVGFRKQLYSNPRYCRHMDVIMPWLHNRGALDYDTDNDKQEADKDACARSS